MHTDRQGNPLPDATRAAADLYDAAIEASTLYAGDPVGLLDQAIAEAPRCTMARLAKAWLFGLSTEPEATAAARGLVAEVRDLPMSAHEQAHAAAIDLVTAREWGKAAITLDRLSMRHPRDLMALQAGHLIDFYLADARGLRDRVARALPHWEGVPGRSVVVGMHAFGLEESGDHAAAEKAGRAAVEADARDCWAHHAVAHVLEMQGRAAEGVRWAAEREAQWAGETNYFKIHNWWHRALCHLELGEPEKALALYDGPIRGTRSIVALDLVDASALLWRLEASGADVGTRWEELSSAWEAQANGRLYPFNDWHAVMAHLGAGRDDEAERLLGELRRADGSQAADWARTIGAPLVEGFIAFKQGRHARAVDVLMGVRHIANAFGGSHAQRDVIDWTLTEAALRGGLADVAEAMAVERLALRPASAVNRAFLTRARALALARPAD
jgi:tetratricopeptide (TPR) repeat protein